MKTIVTMAAALAAFTTTPSFAQETAGGRYEWQSRQVPGPNKSGTPSRVRVWVQDQPSQMASCDCDMMKTNAAGCMKAMHGQRVSPSEG